MQKKKKVDYEALNAPLMRIPKMDIAVVRALLDMGIKQTYELQGRAPEILYEEAKKKNHSLNKDSVRFFRLAVYYAENATHDNQLLHPDAWK